MTEVPTLAPNAGVIGVLAQETARFSMFPASLTSTLKPHGTTVRWQFGHSIAANQNDLVRYTLSQPWAQWLWLLGDDHSWSPDLLVKLLEHDRDIVVPLCLMRNTPFKPVANIGKVGDGPWRRRLNLGDHPDGGLVPIHSAGSGGMLIKRSVLEAVADPWFESPAGEHLGEDFVFCDKARDAGAELFCDLDANLGHITTAVVWPVKLEEEGFSFGFSFMGGYQIVMPPQSWPAEAPVLRPVPKEDD